MHSILSFLLTIIIESFNIVSPNGSMVNEIRNFQTPYLVVSPSETTSLYKYQLNGPVKNIQLEDSFFGEKNKFRLPVQTLQFDTHGYFTEKILCFGDDKSTDKFSNSIINNYNDQNRLTSSTLTTKLFENDIVNYQLTSYLKHEYDDKGILTNISASFSEPGDLTKQAKENLNNVNAPVRFDNKGRLTNITYNTDNKSAYLKKLTNNYYYNPDGGFYVDINYNNNKNIEHRQWFDKNNRLVKWYKYSDSNGKILNKTFIKYDDTGDIIRMSLLLETNKKPMILEWDEYKYDDYHNWTERMNYDIKIDSGIEIRNPVLKQNRKITYYEPVVVDTLKKE
jgi:hypothetical protein